MLPVSHTGEKFDSDIVRSCVGGVVCLRFGFVFFTDVSIVEVPISEVSEVLISEVSISEVSISEVLITDVLAICEGVVDVAIVVVTYVIAVIDTAVAKVMEEARVFWRLVCARSPSGAGVLEPASSSWIRGKCGECPWLVC